MKFSIGCAGMAELVDAKDLKSFGLIACAGSSPALGTSLFIIFHDLVKNIFIINAPEEN